jgi:hypothetical protein
MGRLSRSLGTRIVGLMTFLIAKLKASEGVMFGRQVDYPLIKDAFKQFSGHPCSLAKCMKFGQEFVEGFRSDGIRSVETNLRNRLFSNNLVWNLHFPPNLGA